MPEAFFNEQTIPAVTERRTHQRICYIRYDRVEHAVKLYESLMKKPLVAQGRTIRCDFDFERPASVKTMDGRPSTCLMLDHIPMDNTLGRILYIEPYSHTAISKMRE